MPDFTTRWFDRVVHRWREYLLEYSSVPIVYLEIGIFEGKSACWMLDNVLLHSSSRYVGIDAWCLNKRRYPVPAVIEERARRNLSPYGDKVRIIKQKSQEVLQDPSLDLWDVDIAYIDGDHALSAVLLDSCMVWQRVRSGGIVMWDDYMMHRKKEVGEAVDYFLGTIPGQYVELWRGWQVAVRKR